MLIGAHRHLQVNIHLVYTTHWMIIGLIKPTFAPPKTYSKTLTSWDVRLTFLKSSDFRLSHNWKAYFGGKPWHHPQPRTQVAVGQKGVSCTKHGEGKGNCSRWYRLMAEVLPLLFHSLIVVEAMTWWNAWKSWTKRKRRMRWRWKRNTHVKWRKQLTWCQNVLQHYSTFSFGKTALRNPPFTPEAACPLGGMCCSLASHSPKWHGSSTWEATVFMFSYCTFEFLKTDMTIMTICFFGDFAIDCLAVETPKSTKMKILVYRFRGWTMTFDLLNDSWTLQRRRGIENISLKLVDWFTWGILQW